MPKKRLEEQVSEALALIPATGEIEYTAWQDAMRSAGLHSAVEQGYALKRYGVKFRNEVTPTSKKVFVSRSA